MACSGPSAADPPTEWSAWLREGGRECRHCYNTPTWNLPCSTKNILPSGICFTSQPLCQDKVKGHTEPIKTRMTGFPPVVVPALPSLLYAAVSVDGPACEQQTLLITGPVRYSLRATAPNPCGDSGVVVNIVGPTIEGLPLFPAWGEVGTLRGGGGKRRCKVAILVSSSTHLFHRASVPPSFLGKGSSLLHPWLLPGGCVGVMVDVVDTAIGGHPCLPAWGKSLALKG